jgi:hypothetical protein
MKRKLCKNCDSPDLVKDRKICKECNRKRVKEHYKKHGKKCRSEPNSVCKACKKNFISWRKTQVICGDCYRESLNTGFRNNQYLYNPKQSDHQHRRIAELLLGRKLDKNEVVHHVDENPKNNQINNLWVLSRHNHGKLHKFLRLQKVIYEKSLDCNSVNCWELLRVDQTTAWLEMTGANVIKLIELDNQQPSLCNEEGSETRHGEPDHLVEG